MVNDDTVLHTNDFHSYHHNAMVVVDSVESDRYHFHYYTDCNWTYVDYDDSLDSVAVEHFVDSNDDSDEMVLVDRKIHSVNVV